MLTMPKTLVARYHAELELPEPLAAADAPREAFEDAHAALIDRVESAMESLEADYGAAFSFSRDAIEITFSFDDVADGERSDLLGRAFGVLSDAAARFGGLLGGELVVRRLELEFADE